MQNVSKEWLVRTRTGEILGPFTQRELLEELHMRTFSPEDEISPSHGYWISAQTLTNRDADEFTLTHTRNQTNTKSLHTASGSTAPGIYRSTDLAHAPASPAATAQPEQEERTPPPDSSPASKMSAHDLSGARTGVPALGRIVPMVVGMAVLAILITIFVRGRNRGQSSPSGSPSSVSPAREGESPFVRQIYSMIRLGGSQAALKQLVQYHEKHPAKGDLEYLVPYAALLITEGETPLKAKRLLDQVLAGPASPQLKSRAHHWLGYLLLSQDEGDMGESHFLEALQLNPKDAAARFDLGRAYLKQEKFPQAFDYLALAELEMPDLWLVHIYKGRAKAALGNMDEARASFKTAVEASPDRWITYIYYALFSKGVSDAEGAQAILRRMLTRDPSFEIHSPPPWGFYQEKVNYGEYLTAFATVMEKAPGEERELGKLYINYLLSGPNSTEGKKLEAVAVTGGALAKELGLKAALDREASLEDIKLAVNRLPVSLSDLGAYAYVLRGEGKARLGLFAEAQQDFSRALTLDPRSAIAHFDLANLFRKTQRSADAESEIKSLLLYHPNYIPAIVPSQNQ